MTQQGVSFYALFRDFYLTKGGFYCTQPGGNLTALVFLSLRVLCIQIAGNKPDLQLRIRQVMR